MLYFFRVEYNVLRSLQMESQITRQVKVSAKGWIVIPAPLRRRYGLTPGTIVNIEDAEGKLILYPQQGAPYKRARGMLPAEPSLAAELLADRAKDLEREETSIRL
jgi:AbrB family looped-hinge helix DNA binding protein